MSKMNPLYQLKIYDIGNTRAKLRVYFHLVGNTRALIENTRAKARVYHQQVVEGAVTARPVKAHPPANNPQCTLASSLIHCNSSMQS